MGIVSVAVCDHALVYTCLIHVYLDVQTPVTEPLPDDSGLLTVLDLQTSIVF